MYRKIKCTGRMADFQVQQDNLATERERVHFGRVINRLGTGGAINGWVGVGGLNRDQK